MRLLYTATSLGRLAAERNGTRKTQAAAPVPRISGAYRSWRRISGPPLSAGGRIGEGSAAQARDAGHHAEPVHAPARGRRRQRTPPLRRGLGVRPATRSALPACQRNSALPVGGARRLRA